MSQLRRRVALAALLLVAVPVLAACSSSSDSASAESTDAFSAYQACLAENGVTLPSGGPGGQGPGGGAAPSGMPTDRPSGMPTDRPSGMPSGAPGGGMGVPDGVDASAFAAAQEACASLRPSGAPGRGGPGAGTGSSTDSGQLAAFVSCMKDNGVTVTDVASLNTDDAATAAALKVCGALMPSAAASSPSPATTASP